MSAIRLGLLLVVASGLGCGSKSSSSAIQASAASESSSTFAQVQERSLQSQSLGDLELKGPQVVSHSGDCQVQLFDASGNLLQSYREELVSDGGSRFSLKPIESLIPVAPEWDHLKRIREGYAFRYGCFELRSVGAVVQNFVITPGGPIEIIAGQPCHRFLVSPVTGTGPSYRIWIDQNSQLALRSETYDKQGTLRFTRKYESLNLSPDLSGVVWFQSIYNEELLDPFQSLDEQVDLPVQLPKLLPAGYVALNAYKLIFEDEIWIKLVYTNGIEPLFMLQKPRKLREDVSQATGSQGQLDLIKPKGQDPRAGSDLLVMDIDGVIAVHTEQLEGIFEVVGIADEHELVDMISSALPAR